MGKIWNVAILGAGNIAGSMATALKAIPETVCMYAVASRSLEKAEAFKDKWGFQKAYGSYEELAADSNIDLIYVATPHSEHYKNTKLCLENGRNCLVEKAFCANLKQAEELIAIAREKNLLLVEAMWTRFQPSRNRIKDLLDSGIIGDIHYIESDFSVPILGVDRLVNPNLAGGALLDLGVYSLTIPVMFYGTDIKNIRVNSMLTDTGVDATDTIFLNYKDGTMARCKCSSVDSMSNYAKVAGDNGYMVFGPINAPEYVDIYSPEGNLIKHEDISYIANGYEYEVLESLKMLSEGKTEAESMPLSETVRLMGWMDTIRNYIGVVYPFESKEDINHNVESVWGEGAYFTTEDPWDRSNSISYLEIYDTTTGEREVVAEIDGVIEAPNWSHDGKFLVYNGDGFIFKFDLETKTTTKIPSGNLCKMNNDHVLKYDDSEIAVSDESNDTGWSRIHRISLVDGSVTDVTEKTPSYLHGWSSDGKYMCYCAERNGEYDVYEIDTETLVETRLTTAPCLNDGCEYDVSDEYIYFNSVRMGLMQAFRMKKDGTEQTQLTFDKNFNTWFPHISPDKTKIVMISYRKGDLWPGDHIPNRFVDIRMMNADGTNLKTLMTIFGGQGTINVNSWSPDSKKFAFVSYKKKGVDVYEY